MVHLRFVSLTLIALLLSLPAGGTEPNEKTVEEVLSEHHLARSRSLYVLDAEADALDKRDEVAALLSELNVFFQQKAAYLKDMADMKMLEDRRSRLRREINDINVMLGRFPRRRNSVQQGQYGALVDQRDGDQLDLDETVRNLDVLRNRAPGPQEMRRIDAEIERLRTPYLDAVRALRVLVDQVRDGYATLAADPDVQRVLEQSRQPGGARMGLGPSAGHLKAVGQLKQFEAVFPAEVRRAPFRPIVRRKGAKPRR